MSAAWPKVKLGEVLRHRKEFITIDDLATYRRPRVQLHAQGIVLRDEVEGGLVKTKKQQVCRAGEFLVAEIDAKVGGFGLVPETLDGAIVSSHYFLFGTDPTRLDRRFLDWYIRTHNFRDQVEAQGSTNYAAIRPADVLGYEIPLPPLAEQQRIVARIEALAEQIREAQRLRQETTDEADALLAAESQRVFSRLKNEFGEIPFSTFAPHVTSGPRNWSDRYAEDGVRFYRAQDLDVDGQISKAGIVRVALPDSGQGRSAALQAGDLLLVITGATVGRVAVFESNMEPGLVSQHVALCRLPQDQLLPRYAWWGLRSPFGQEQLLGQRYGQGKPGLNLGNIRALVLPFPTLEKQRQVVAELDTLQVQVDALKRAQAETAAELDALLPAILDKIFRGEL